MSTLGTASAHAQVFLNLDGFGIGNGGGTVQTDSGPATDSVNINNLFFPQFSTQTANIGVGNRGYGYAVITTSSGFDSGMIQLQSLIVAQGASTCDQPGAINCGNGSATAGVTTRATFRVSEEAVLFLGAYLVATSHVDPGIGGSGNSSSTCNVVITEGPTTLFGRTVRNSNGTLTEATVPDGGVARLFPNIDYAITTSASGDGQAFGLNSVATAGSTRTLVTIRLFPPACPTVTAPTDVTQCMGQQPVPAMFTVIASGALPRTVQWQRFNAGIWSDLTDGPVGGVGMVSGATTTTLTISGAGMASNAFRSVVQNDCGIAFSTAATLTLDAFCCDPIDFNNDTSLFDPQDIEAFLSVYSEGPCIPAGATCNDIDFNNDGSVFDPCDFDSFLLVFSEGPCTPCGN